MILLEFDQDDLDGFPVQVQEALLRMALRQETKRLKARGVEPGKPLNADVKWPDPKKQEEVELANTLSGGGKILHVDLDPLKRS